jgi:hypothetical protein
MVVVARYKSENHPASALGLPLSVLDSGRGVNRKTAWMGLAMNTDTNRPDDPDPDDLDGLAVPSSSPEACVPSWFSSLRLEVIAFH